ncbi:hypothetical protein AArc1_5112 (plasmid) [Natrarchaeobaculum sulfurireducens]|uniref:Uncharacterized protein n=1 Tax=Natrarchaeobaculum sulfurireducens TaxID=2044521 RepID=A0A346P9W8_9EURY|nr:hypothetical protein AArc1_5112 [Natrarchaeobaculum sulfurireducens]
MCSLVTTGERMTELEGPPREGKERFKKNRGEIITLALLLLTQVLLGARDAERVRTQQRAPSLANSR